MRPLKLTLNFVKILTKTVKIRNARTNPIRQREIQAVRRAAPLPFGQSRASQIGTYIYLRLTLKESQTYISTARLLNGRKTPLIYEPFQGRHVPFFA